MTSVQPPPLYEVVADQAGKSTTPWVLFFNQIYNGDSGSSWVPTFQNLGATGTPSATGEYWRVSKYLQVFRITITPSTDTTSTAGSTYCDNFPLSVNGDGICVAVGGSLGIGTGIVQNNGRIYPPSWTGATVPVTIMGLVGTN